RPGWLRLASSCTSSRWRARPSASVRPFASTFTATSRPSASSVARCTVDIPPRPSSWERRYRPPRRCSSARSVVTSQLLMLALGVMLTPSREGPQGHSSGGQRGGYPRTVESVLLYIVGVIVIVIGLALSIALHEVGHLVPAKLFGVRVGQYMIGFGPTLWS